MKYLDRVIQRLRIRQAAAYIKPGDRICDIGCADGAIFRLIRGLGESVGIEPDLDPANLQPIPGVQFHRGYFPEALPQGMMFDAITLLAVLEHVPTDRQAPLARACARHLTTGGRLIITVPSLMTDHVLAMLRALHLIHGMSLEQHYGFVPSQTPGIFSPHGLKLVVARRFQCGLNNLFVFERTAEVIGEPGRAAGPSMIAK